MTLVPSLVCKRVTGHQLLYIFTDRVLQGTDQVPFSHAPLASASAHLLAFHSTQGLKTSLQDRVHIMGTLWKQTTLEAGQAP